MLSECIMSRRPVTQRRVSGVRDLELSSGGVGWGQQYFEHSKTGENAHHQRAQNWGLSRGNPWSSEAWRSQQGQIICDLAGRGGNIGLYSKIKWEAISELHASILMIRLGRLKYHTYCCRRAYWIWTRMGRGRPSGKLVGSRLVHGWGGGSRRWCRRVSKTAGLLASSGFPSDGNDLLCSLHISMCNVPTVFFPSLHFLSLPAECLAHSRFSVHIYWFS